MKSVNIVRLTFHRYYMRACERALYIESVIRDDYTMETRN